MGSPQRKPTTVETEAQKFTVALDHFPEFAAEVGVLISCFALIESYMPKLISSTTNMDESEAFMVSGSFVSFSARIDLLDNLIKKKDPKSKEVIAAQHFVKILREATTIRNNYAHGKYSIAKNNIMHVTSFIHDAKRKNPRELVRDLDGIKKDVKRMKFIICELHGYVYRGEMPVISR